MKRFVSISAAAFLLFGTLPALAAGQAPDAARFHSRAQEILAHWGSPGAVVSIVKNGQVLFQQGYGQTKLQDGHPVTPSTMTTVASVTKTFNSVALGILVEEGLLAWDDPVKHHVPEFRFADEFRTEATTLRDLITHRGGLPAVLGGLRSMEYTMPQLLADLPSQPPVAGFRERVEYSQVGIALLGEVVRRVSGMSWGQFVHSRILQPLEMASSYAGSTAFLAAFPDPEAVPHLMGRTLRRDGQLVPGPWRGAGEIYTPAGGLVTTAEDMSRFMRALLAAGRFGEQGLLSSGSLAELHAPRAVEGTPYGPILSPFGGIVAYSMGWIAHDFAGYRIVEHPGSNFGSSTIALVPSEDIGVFVSSSANFSLDSDRLVSALKFAALAYALDLEDRDWIGLLVSRN